MKTYLLVWNPIRWPWEHIEKNIEEVNKFGKCSENWSCANNKSIEQGDRVFLIKVGTEPKGIIGAGYVITPPYPGKHWSGENKETLYVDVEFEALLNPDKEPILTLDILKVGKLAAQHWTPQSSGISIKPELVDELEAVWFDFLNTANIRHNPFTEVKEIYTEGSVNQVTLTKYERNPFARNACIDHYGFSCTVCNFNFEHVYGSLGKEFIHVHHLIPVSSIKKEYVVDPVADLRPVCPNCHAMLHRKKEGITIEILKSKVLNS
jgi:5-methylcytosine-specific restriction enzyme A